jgi:hypothetical protein
MNEQGSIEWHRERMGAVTASQFSRVLSNPSARQTYYSELTVARAARLAGGEVEYLERTSFDNQAMAWGRKHEDAARASYELEYDTDVELTGFTLLPGAPDIGASLDGRTHPGTIEIKCPYNQEVHIRTCTHGMPTQHLPQVHGGMWITDEPWCDFISFDPRHPTRRLYVERILRDDAYIDMLATKVLEFAKCMAAGQVLPEYETNDRPGRVPELF